ATIVAAAHWPVLSAQAVGFDDEQFIHDNPLVRNPSWRSVGRFFEEILAPSTVRGYSMPLTMTSLMLDHAAGGRPEDLRAFHRTNLLLHALNTALVVLLMHMLLRHAAAAGFAGLLFGLHPLTVEPVAWVAERKTLLAACFSLLALLSYLRFARTRRRRCWGAALAAYLLALLAKPIALVLPVLLLLLDVWPLRRTLRSAFTEKIPFLLLGAGFGLVAWISHERTADIQLGAAVHPLEGLWRAGYLNLFYLGRFFWPVDLSSIYVLPDLSGCCPPAGWMGLIGSAALIAALVFLYRRARGPLIGWLFFAAAVAPTLGIVGYSWVEASDKYMYLPMVGLLLIVTWGLAELSDRVQRRGGWSAARKRAVLAAASGLLLAIAAGEALAVRAYLTHWRDTLGLHEYMAARAPGSAEVQTNLGVALSESGRGEEAIAHFRRALEIDPRHVGAYNNLGCLLAERGVVDEAIEHFRHAVQIHPGHAEAHFNLGNAWLQKARVDEAVAAYRRAIAIRPMYARAHHRLAQALLLLGETEEARASEARALEADPSLLDAREALALLEIQAGNFDEALLHLRLVLRARPSAVRPLTAAAWVLSTDPRERMRRPEEALELAERAVALTRGQSPGPLDVLAAAHAAAGRFERAVETGRRALELARSEGSPVLAAEIEARLSLYEQGKPFRAR
ncbi:MAG: tetratricopeptide repeat protein, partial [Candidatus Eisenbacteria bacterium]